MQTPAGHTLGIVSPQPVASWSVDYNLGYQDPAPHWFMGHRIESLNLDLMNALPLPAHCPQDLWNLKQGERRTWIVAFVHIPTPEKFEETLHQVADIPMLRMPRTTFRPGETTTFEMLGTSPAIEITDDQGNALKATVTSKSGGNLKEVSCLLPATGLYTLKVTDNGKQAQGILSARSSWQQTLEHAREGALKYHQKATSHIESWYGFHSSFIAAKYFPASRWTKRCAAVSTTFSNYCTTPGR